VPDQAAAAMKISVQTVRAVSTSPHAPIPKYRSLQRRNLGGGFCFSYKFQSNNDRRVLPFSFFRRCIECKVDAVLMKMIDFEKSAVGCNSRSMQSVIDRLTHE